MSEKKEEFNSNYSIRWRPDFRFTDKKFIDISLDNFKSTEPSVTDKEAYRLTLASLRGEIAQGSGNLKVGSYSLKEGEEYNPDKDFSFLNRKDITIVELDKYIKDMTDKLNNSDKVLSETIKQELAKAEKKHNELVLQQNNKNDEVKK